jgi:flavin-dependent dehydrogenase
MVDLLIAGGGIAGSSLAILMGRQGCTVGLYERSRFPREKPCGEGLMPAGVAVLERLGVAEEVGGKSFVGVRYHAGNEMVEGRFPKTKGLPDTGRGQRRLHLDQVLFAAAARTQGVRAHAGVCVSAPLVEKGRVTGLIVDGTPQRARYVVAADGSNSRLRHQFGLARPPREKRFGVRIHFRLPLRAETSEWVEVFLGRGYELYVTPLPRGELLVAALGNGRSLERPIEEQFLRWLREHPWLARRLRGAEQISQAQTAPLGARASRGVGRGFVLLGDAAGSLDPITGGGMTQALLSAELLAAELKGGLPAEADCLWRFERRRKAMLADARRLTRLVLALAKRPRLARVAFPLLRAQPGLFSYLLGVSGGTRRVFSRLGALAPSHVSSVVPDPLAATLVARASGHPS